MEVMDSVIVPITVSSALLLADTERFEPGRKARSTGPDSKEIVLPGLGSLSTCVY